MTKYQISPLACRGLSSSMAIAAMMLAVPAAHAQSTEEASESTAPSDEAIIVTGRFIESGAGSATKLDIPVLDTPFSVAAYSGEFLKAIETTNVSDLYRYMNGIQRAGNTGYDITIRGFKSGGNDRNVILTDGLPGLGVRFGSPPTVGVDRIELVKGATSVLYDQAQPGGFINIITKKPLSTPRYEFTIKQNIGVGEYDRAFNTLVSADLTGPINADGTLAFRVVGEIGHGDGFRQHSYEQPIYIAPSLRWDIGPDTSLLLAGEYRRVKTHYDNQLVAPNRDVSLIPRIDRSYQAPGDFLLEKGLIGNATFQHHFSDNITLNASYRYVDHTDEARGFDTVGFRNATTLTRRARGQYNIRTYSFLDANLTAKFDTFGVEHQLLVGGTIGRETSDFDRQQFFNAPATGPLSLDINIYNPVHNELPLSAYPLGSLNRRYTEQKSKGVYISDLITFSDMFKAMVGVRYADEDEYRDDRQFLPPTPLGTKASSKWLPLAGLIFQPTRDLSIYGSYSTSYVPVPAGTQDIFGLNPFPPTLAKAWEAGVKAELFDKNLFVTVAYFDIRKQDTLNTFTCPTTLPPGTSFPPGVTSLATGTCSAPLGGERSRGFEVEFNTTPLPGWQITAGYARTKARVTDSNIPQQVGARLTNSPDDAFNFWSRYDFSGGLLDRLGVGVGVAYVGDRVGFLPTAAQPTNLLTLPSYTTVDAGLYYTVNDNLDFTLKVTNLFDERYIESAGFVADIQLVPGVPRLVTFTARATF